MRALVMSAGLGTRLRPLTDKLPKPLVPLNGKPMIVYVLELLAKHGVKEALVNVHHLPEKMHEFVREWNAAGNSPKLSIQDETQLILESGGGVAKAAAWLFADSETALVCNADVVASPDLTEMLAFHKSKNAETTLCVLEHPEAGIKYTGLRLAADKITAFERSGSHDPGLWHFPGFYLVSVAAMKRLASVGTPCSVVERMWKPQSAEGKLFAWRYRGEYLDLGTVADLQAAEAVLRSKGR